MPVVVEWRLEFHNFCRSWMLFWRLSYSAAVTALTLVTGSADDERMGYFCRTPKLASNLMKRILFLVFLVVADCDCWNHCSRSRILTELVNRIHVDRSDDDDDGEEDGSREGWEMMAGGDEIRRLSIRRMATKIRDERCAGRYNLNQYWRVGGGNGRGTRMRSIRWATGWSSSSSEREIWCQAGIQVLLLLLSGYCCGVWVWIPGTAKEEKGTVSRYFQLLHQTACLSRLTQWKCFLLLLLFFFFARLSLLCTQDGSWQPHIRHQVR